MEKVRKKIKAPTFPNREFLITSYGAVGDGKTLNTDAFRKAIGDCHESGGGRVTVPFGIFLTGAIHLKSNVNLHMADSATILFSTDPKQYLPLVFTRWEGMELMNYSALSYKLVLIDYQIFQSGLPDLHIASRTSMSLRESMFCQNPV